jgi:hypothetical protein
MNSTRLTWLGGFASVVHVPVTVPPEGPPRGMEQWTFTLVRSGKIRNRRRSLRALAIAEIWEDEIPQLICAVWVPGLTPKAA